MQSTGLKDKNILIDIIVAGYQRAAHSFAAITGVEVEIDTTSVELCSDHAYLKNKFEHLVNLMVIQTDIIGDLSGCSYLLLNENEQQSIAQLSLKTFGTSANLDELTILKEIDNIISAAVITELSNRLKINIYGDVPHLFEHTDIGDFHTHLNNDQSGLYLLSHSKFVFGQAQEIMPLFIWKIDKKILELAKG